MWYNESNRTYTQMLFKNPWNETAKGKRKVVAFVAKQDCDTSKYSEKITFKYQKHSDKIVGVAKSKIPLRYATWKTFLRNAELFTDHKMAKQISLHTNEIDIRQCFNLVLGTYK